MESHHPVPGTSRARSLERLTGQRKPALPHAGLPLPAPVRGRCGPGRYSGSMASSLVRSSLSAGQQAFADDVFWRSDGRLQAGRSS